MQLISIDTALCNGCGVCVALCPRKILALGDGVVELQAEDCIRCGHCQAVCPVGAIQVAGLATILGLHHIDEAETIVQPGQMDCAELVRLMRSRRSCRSYSGRPVELTLLEDLVKIGTTAPSGTNSQAWNFILLPSRADVEVLGAHTAEYYRALNRQARNPIWRLAAKWFAGDVLGNYYRNYYASVARALTEWDEEGIDRLFHGATAAILVTGKRAASCPGEDALLATQNILLGAHALGLGSCLIGFVVEAMRRTTQLKQLVAIPADEEIYSVIALGYPAVQFCRVAGRNPVVPRIQHLGGRN